MFRLLLVVGLSGCSLTLSGPDPNRPRSTPPACDSGKGLVALDALLGSGLAVGGIAAAANNSGGAALPMILAGTAFLFSSFHGNTVVDTCRKAQGEYYAQARAPEPPPLADDEPKPEPPPEIEKPPVVPAVAVTPPTAPPPQDPWKDFWREVP